MNKIFLLFLLKQKLSKLEEGFITLEVLVALLSATFFVILNLQFFVSAMAIKVQAQEKQRANQLIQEDIERLNQLGSTLAPGVGGAAPMCDATNYNDGFAQALWDSLPAGTQTKFILEKVNKDDGQFDTDGQQLALRRFHISSTANNSNTPHRTLRVGYQVWDWDGANYVNRVNNDALTSTDTPIAETYVEIIPDAALQCP